VPPVTVERISVVWRDDAVGSGELASFSLGCGITFVDPVGAEVVSDVQDLHAGKAEDV
jgi:hypothetical protein